jgi:integration host factor subunit alpha
MATVRQTITRVELSEAVRRKVGLPLSDSREMLERVLEEIGACLVRGETVKLSAFGSFRVRRKGHRVGRNPMTRQEVPILPRRVVVFKPSSVMKQRINPVLAPPTATPPAD